MKPYIDCCESGNLRRKLSRRADNGLLGAALLGLLNLDKILWRIFSCGSDEQVPSVVTIKNKEVVQCFHGFQCWVRYWYCAIDHLTQLNILLFALNVCQICGTWLRYLSHFWILFPFVYIVRVMHRTMQKTNKMSIVFSLRINLIRKWFTTISSLKTRLQYQVLLVLKKPSRSDPDGLATKTFDPQSFFSAIGSGWGTADLRLWLVTKIN